MKGMGKLALLAPVILVFAACASNLEAKKMPGADLAPLKTFYVQKLATDDHGVEQLITSQLTRMGFIAVSGASEMPSSPVDAIVTYQDKWWWDFSSYLLQLNVQIRDGQTRMVLANGQSMRTSLVRKDPEAMVEEVLTKIFKRERQ